MNLEKIRNFFLGKDSSNQTITFFIAKIVIILCGTFLSLVFNAQSAAFFVQAFKGNKSQAFFCMCAIVFLVFVGLVLLFFKFKFIEKQYERHLENTLVSRIFLLLFSIMCAGTYIAQFYSSANQNLKFLNEVDQWWFHIPSAFEVTSQSLSFTPPRWILTLILFIPLTIFYLYFITSFVELIKDLLTTLSKTEKNFLIIALATIVVYVIFIYNSTSVYYGGLDRIYSYDSLPGSDYLINPFYYWSYYQYPLEPNFSLPVMMAARLFTPSVFIWEVCIRAILQYALLFLVIIMLSRMISDNPKIRFYTLCIFSFSFPTIVLAMVTERRVITFIFLISAIYQSIYRKKYQNLWLSVASGAVICNAYVALLSMKSKKTFVKDAFCFGGVFLFIASFLGKISGLLDLKSQINNFEGRGWIATSLTFKTKLFHYLNFVCSSLISPLSSPLKENNGWGMSPQETDGHTFYIIVGAVILALALLGFICNYKKTIAKIALVGVIVSFYFVFIKAININENAVVLNTLFFAWSFISLTIMGIDKIFNKNEMKTIPLKCILCFCVAFNIVSAYQIYNFGLTAFPIAR